MIERTHAVLLAGGSGTRFWPVSRAAHPKQFLDILGTGRSLLQATVERVQKLIPPERLWIVGSQAHATLIAQQVPHLLEDHRLLEPLQRNTAFSILWATQVIAAQAPEAILWILPADHYIPDEKTFLMLIQRILTECDFSEAILTVGIRPRYPHTGYGYIQFIPTAGRLCQPVKTFTEKPSKELAQLFVQSGDFLWNSGMFIASAAVLKRAFQTHAPDMYELLPEGGEYAPEFLQRAFQQAPSISFDYAIMEKYQPVLVVEGDFAWWDLGGWNAVHEVSPQDAHGNTTLGQVLREGVKNTLFFASRSDKLIIAQGLEGYLVIDTEDVLLIVPKSAEQDIREWVQRLRAEGRTRYL